MNKEIKWDLIDHEVGYRAYDWIEHGVRCLVMRGPFHWCAYLGIPKDHPLAGFGYDDIPLHVHGGLTFSEPGKKGDKRTNWPEDRYWYGWDYGHCDDASYFTKDIVHVGGTRWTADQVKAEIEEALWDFKKLLSLAEKIAAKAR